MPPVRWIFFLAKLRARFLMQALARPIAEGHQRNARDQWMIFLQRPHPAGRMMRHAETKVLPQPIDVLRHDQ